MYCVCVSLEGFLFLFLFFSPVHANGSGVRDERHRQLHGSCDPSLSSLNFHSASRLALVKVQKESTTHVDELQKHKLALFKRSGCTTEQYVIVLNAYFYILVHTRLPIHG